ncbi:hypothetical protein GUJ93_ZPchr0006g45650 [Zizania palustris]|uniref:Uncharacterized protein n=1 Tax=Zizania palustris TaxID=103762 RepID=A0A8J5SU79_ZIZPA|nr:hypothetical protein GUJ93_ZPchr0006g45650 [Zizania palustris]
MLLLLSCCAKTLHAQLLLCLGCRAKGASPEECCFALAAAPKLPARRSCCYCCYRSRDVRLLPSCKVRMADSVGKRSASLGTSRHCAACAAPRHFTECHAFPCNRKEIYH